MKNTVIAVRPANEAHGKAFLAMLLTQGITAETINAFELKKLQEAIDSKGYLWFMLELAKFINAGSRMPQAERLMVDLSVLPFQPFPGACIDGNERGITREISFLDITLLKIEEDLTGKQIAKKYEEEYYFLNSSVLDFIFMNQYDYRIKEHVVKKINLEAQVFAFGDLFSLLGGENENRIRSLINQGGVILRKNEPESKRPTDYKKFASFENSNLNGYHVAVMKKMNQLGN